MLAQRCPRCGNEVEGLQFSCPECGTPLPYTCPFCGRKHEVVPKCCGCMPYPNDPTLEFFLMRADGANEAQLRKISETDYRMIYEDLVTHGKIPASDWLEHGDVTRTDNVEGTGYYLLKQTEQPLVDELPQTLCVTIYLTREEYEAIDERIPKSDEGSDTPDLAEGLSRITDPYGYFEAVDEWGEDDQ